MSFKVQVVDHTSYLEAEPTAFILRDERDVLALITACIEYDSPNVLLYEANFSPEFFDLKSQLAGALLQKLANYHLRGAVVISMKGKSDRFKELALECNRGILFRFFEDKDAAERWLVGGIE